jgi:hypothetical protein
MPYRGLLSRAAVALSLAGLLSGCDEADGIAGPSSAAQLRIVNASGVPFTQLSALFPQDQVSFGDVPPGATTQYRAVPGGVYRYAAWRYYRDGASVLEPVIDWVGESPM